MAGQLVIVGVIVAAASWYLVRSLRKAWTKGQTACRCPGSEDHGETRSKNREYIPVENLKLRQISRD